MVSYLYIILITAHKRSKFKSPSIHSQVFDNVKVDISSAELYTAEEITEVITVLKDKHGDLRKKFLLKRKAIDSISVVHTPQCIQLSASRIFDHTGTVALHWTYTSL